MAVHRNINVRSPFYVQLVTSEVNVTLELRIWSGDLISNRPTDATYTLLKEQSEGQSTFEIAELVRDYCVQTEAYNSGKVWVETILNDTNAAPTTTTYLASEGYSLYKEGVQHNGNSYVSEFAALPEYDVEEYRVLTTEGRRTHFQVYVQPQNTTDWYYNTYDFYGGFAQKVMLDPSTQSSDQFVTVDIGRQIGKVVFYFDGDQFTVTADQLDCNKYNAGVLDSSNDEPVYLHYVNKYGAKNSFPFSLKHMEDVSIKSDGFQRSVLNYNGLTNQNGKHAFRKRITATKQKFTVNTDWISEYYVKQLEELLLSEYVWASIPSVSSNKIPVNITTSQLQKKNHLNDKLIQYSIQFDSGSDYLNTVR